MTKRRNKKQALMASILSLVLCVSMLLGTTMAWFTDTVANNGNRIEAGTLKVKLLRHDGSEYQDISNGTGDIFIPSADEDPYVEGRPNGTLWEPNKTEIVYLAVENAGNLALNYNIILNVTNANTDPTKTAKLEEVLSYAVISGLEAKDSTVKSWKDIQGLSNAQTGNVPVGETPAAENGALTAGNRDYFALAVHMDENAGNDYQGTALNIDVKIVAKQMSYEEDSFGKEYDANALWVEKEEKFEVYFNRTFDEGADELVGINSWLGTDAEFAVKEDNTGNKYLNMTRNLNGGCILEIPISSVSEKMMVEFDLSTEKFGKASVYLNGSVPLASPQANGEIYVGGGSGTLIASFESENFEDWIKFAYAIDLETQTIDVYVNGNLVVDDWGFSDFDVINEVTSLKIQILEAGGANLKIDNIKIYEGTTIRDNLPQVKDEEDELVLGNCIMPTYQDAISNLTGKVAVHVYGDSLFADGQKTSLDTPVQMEKGANSILVPANVISEGLGLAVNVDGQTITVGDNVKMTVGSTSMTINNENVDLAVAPKLEEGKILLPLYEIAEKVQQKKILWDDHGIIIISDENVNLNEAQLLSINNYMLYDHLSTEEILEKFSKTHPRVMVTEDTFTNIVNQYNAGGIMREWGDEVILMADLYLMQPLPVMDRNLAKSVWLQTAQGIKTRIEHLAIAYYLTSDTKYADKVYDELENAANFSSWCIDDYLVTAEYMTAFAIGYDWLYDYYTPEQREVIEKALYEKGIINSLKAYYGAGGKENSGWWAKDTINWNIVCNGGGVLGAVALLDVYPDVAADVLVNALKGMEFALASYYPDGAWNEGIGYWEFTTEFAVRTITTLTSCFGDDFNLSDCKGFSTTANMPIHINGYVATNNYHDKMEGDGLFVAEEMFWLADRFNDPGVATIKYDLMQQLGISPTPLDMIYCNTSQLEGENLYPLDMYLGGDELVTMRTSWSDASGTYLSFHGGDAHVNHGQVDTGTFVIDMLGERIASDLGAESYDHPNYKGISEGRYTLYRARPEGHNMIVFNPDETPGIEIDSFAKVEKLESKTKGAYSVLNLQDAYRKYVSDYKRGYKLEDDRRSVVIRDEFTLLDDSNGYWFMHTNANIEIQDETTAILTKNHKKFLVRFVTNLTDFTLKEMAAVPLSSSPVVDGQADNTAQGWKKLALEFNAQGNTSIYIEMKVIPYYDPASSDSLTNCPIEDWSIPDGEMSVLPKADMIYSNGDEIFGFDSDKFVYTVSVPKGNGIPTITADTSNGVMYEVDNASDFSGTTTVKVMNQDDPDFCSYYYINFREIDIKVNDLPGAEGVTRHNVKYIYTINNLDTDVNVLDGDLNTLWYAKGTGKWLILDLGSEQKINAFGLATYKGTTRSLNYTIDISHDGINWENILQGTAKLTNDPEILPIDEVSARYVRLTGYGTSVDQYNSITEFATLYYEE